MSCSLEPWRLWLSGSSSATQPRCLSDGSTENRWWLRCRTVQAIGAPGYCLCCLCTMKQCDLLIRSQRGLAAVRFWVSACVTSKRSCHDPLSSNSSFSPLRGGHALTGTSTSMVVGSASWVACLSNLNQEETRMILVDDELSQLSRESKRSVLTTTNVSIVHSFIFAVQGLSCDMRFSL